MAGLARAPRSAAGSVPRGGRALLLVTALAAGGVPALRPLYRLLDLATAALAWALGVRYGRRVRLRGGAATRAGAVAAVEALAAHPEVVAVDVLLNLHGLPGRLTFADGLVATADLAPALRAAGRGKLRLAYSSACHGESHGADLLGAGFAASVGARRVNTTGGTEFGLFLLLWAAGVSVRRALRVADHPLLRRPTDAVAGAVLSALGERGEVDSRKAVAGEGASAIGRRPARASARVELPR
jgi:hypothetical protein